MAPSIDNWTVLGYRRPVLHWNEHGERESLSYNETVVAALDPRGWEWHVTLTEDETEIATLEIHGKITPKALRVIPLEYLHTAALEYLERMRADDLPAADALVEANIQRDPKKGQPPSLQEVAQVWDDFEKYEGKRMTRSRRQRMADRWHVSKPTVDRWIRRARDAGLIHDSPDAGGKETPGG